MTHPQPLRRLLGVAGVVLLGLGGLWAQELTPSPTPAIPLASLTLAPTQALPPLDPTEAASPPPLSAPAMVTPTPSPTPFVPFGKSRAFASTHYPTASPTAGVTVVDTSGATLGLPKTFDGSAHVAPIFPIGKPDPSAPVALPGQKQIEAVPLPPPSNTTIEVGLAAPPGEEDAADESAPDTKPLPPMPPPMPPHVAQGRAAPPPPKAGSPPGSVAVPGPTDRVGGPPKDVSGGKSQSMGQAAGLEVGASSADAGEEYDTAAEDDRLKRLDAVVPYLLPALCLLIGSALAIAICLPRRGGATRAGRAPPAMPTSPSAFETPRDEGFNPIVSSPEEQPLTWVGEDLDP
jgi:hypothetical protein